jgi:hypothetical protein
MVGIGCLHSFLFYKLTRHYLLFIILHIAANSTKNLQIAKYYVQNILNCGKLYSVLLKCFQFLEKLLTRHNFVFILALVHSRSSAASLRGKLVRQACAASKQEHTIERKRSICILAF